MGTTAAGYVLAVRKSFMQRSVIAGLLPIVFAGPGSAIAGSLQDEEFRQYVIRVCNTAIVPPEWDQQGVTDMCGDFFPGGGANAGANNISVNVGTSNAGASASARSQKAFRERLDEEEEKPKRGASSDGGKWGLFVAPQYGEGDRPETVFENGFNSKLKGLALGLDYRLSDSLVVGMALGHTRDDSTFLSNVGFLNFRNSTVTMYGTWLPADRVGIDAYLGYGRSTLESQRQVVLGTFISGTASGDTSGRQMMGGFSASYQADLGRINVSPFINLDAIKSTVDGYQETGSTLLELRYSDRETKSVTSSLGVRVGTTHGFGWGSLSPFARIAAVHEYQNDAASISNELVITPGTGFLVQTDSPDRDYLNIGAGVAAGLNSGTQLFVNYEARVKDELLKSWAVSVGALIEF